MKRIFVDTVGVKYSTIFTKYHRSGSKEGGRNVAFFVDTLLFFVLLFLLLDLYAFEVVWVRVIFGCNPKLKQRVTQYDVKNLPVCRCWEVILV